MVKVRGRTGGFVSNESVTEYHGTRHFRCTIPLCYTFSLPPSFGVRVGVRVRARARARQSFVELLFGPSRGLAPSS